MKALAAVFGILAGLCALYLLFVWGVVLATIFFHGNLLSGLIVGIILFPGEILAPLGAWYVMSKFPWFVFAIWVLQFVFVLLTRHFADRESSSPNQSPIPRIPRELFREPRGARALRIFFIFLPVVSTCTRVAFGRAGPYEDLILMFILELLFWQLVAIAILWVPKLVIAFLVWLFRFLAWLVK